MEHISIIDSFILGLALTYTQITQNKDGSAIQPSQHGVNRDYARACAVTPEIAVVAVADGCSLVTLFCKSLLLKEVVSFIYKSGACFDWIHEIRHTGVKWLQKSQLMNLFSTCNIHLKEEYEICVSKISNNE